MNDVSDLNSSGQRYESPLRETQVLRPQPHIQLPKEHRPAVRIFEQLLPDLLLAHGTAPQHPDLLVQGAVHVEGVVVDGEVHPAEVLLLVVASEVVLEYYGLRQCQQLRSIVDIHDLSIDVRLLVLEVHDVEVGKQALQLQGLVPPQGVPHLHHTAIHLRQIRLQQRQNILGLDFHAFDDAPQ